MRPRGKVLEDRFSVADPFLIVVVRAVARVAVVPADFILVRSMTVQAVHAGPCIRPARSLAVALLAPAAVPGLAVRALDSVRVPALVLPVRVAPALAA
jgi:hypothetical protein